MTTESFAIQEMTLNDYGLDPDNLMWVIIYASIEKIGLQMTFQYKDELDIKNNLPLKGGETLKFTIVDKKLEKEFVAEYIVYEVKEIFKQNEKDDYIEFKAIEKEAFVLINKRVNICWNDPMISDIVSEIDSEAEVEPTKEPLTHRSIQIPGWSVNKTIQYLSKFAISNKSEYSSNYLYYQTLEGRKFQSLGKTLDVDEAKNFVFNQANPKYKYNIIDYNTLNQFNALDYAYSNVYESKQAGVDIDTKKVVSNENDIDTLFNDTYTLGESKNYIQLGEEIGSKYDFINPISSGLVKENPYTQLANFEFFTKRLEILINGTLDFNVGDVINIEWKKRFTKTDANQEMNGLYLVRKVAYFFNRKEWTIKAEVIKNASYEGGETISNNIVSATLIDD